jgi:DNA invertase Pin-like site-specific DNA recombinase
VNPHDEASRDGDTPVVWRLDRLGQSLKHLIETITALQKRNICFKSLTEQKELPA